MIIILLEEFLMKKRFFSYALLAGLAVTSLSVANVSAQSAEDVIAGLEVQSEIDTGATVAGEGSSTVFPILNVLVEDFFFEYDLAVELGGNGTGSGFSALIQGDVSFANASRDIKDEEIADLEENEINWEEYLVATDGLTVAVNQSIDFVEDLTFEELAAIYSGEATNWSEVRDEFPDQDITVYGPTQDHGTHGFFVETIFGDDGEVGDNVQLIQDTNEVVRSVVNDETAIGFFGYNFYMENQDSLTALAIQSEDMDAPAEPTFENVMDFTYPLARPLFVYTDQDALAENTSAHAFLEYVIINSQEAAEAVGYVPLDDATLLEQYNKLPNVEPVEFDAADTEEDAEESEEDAEEEVTEEDTEDEE